MIDHMGIAVRDHARSKAFYARALAPIGYELLMEVPRQFTQGKGVAGFGQLDPDGHNIEAVCHLPE